MIKTFFYFKLFCLTINHNNASSSENVYLLLSLTTKSTHMFVKKCYGLFSLVNCAWSVHISPLIQARLFFQHRKQYYWTGILATVWSKKKILLICLLQTQLLASLDVNWWSGVVWITCGLLWCFYQMFKLSFWRHPFIAEDPLENNWCNATFLQEWVCKFLCA